MNRSGRLARRQHDKGSGDKQAAQKPLLPNPEADQADRDCGSGSRSDHRLSRPGLPCRAPKGIPDRKDQRAEAEREEMAPILERITKSLSCPALDIEDEADGD